MVLVAKQFCGFRLPSKARGATAGTRPSHRPRTLMSVSSYWIRAVRRISHGSCGSAVLYLLMLGRRTVTSFFVISCCKNLFHQNVCYYRAVIMDRAEQCSVTSLLDYPSSTSGIVNYPRKRGRRDVGDEGWARAGLWSTFQRFETRDNPSPTRRAVADDIDCI